MNSEVEIIIKSIKDFLLVIIFLLFLKDVLSGYKLVNNLLVWLMIAIIFVSFFITSLDGKPFLAIIGLRSFSPFLMIFIAYNYLDMDMIGKIVKILSFVLVLGFCAAFAHAFLGYPIEGTTYFGLAARPFGIFFHPWSFATFICFVLCFRVGFDISLYKRATKGSLILIVLSTLFIFLAGSGTGLLTLSVFFISYFFFFCRLRPYIKAVVMPILLLIPLFAFANLQLLTGRSNIYISVKTRIDILVDFINSAGIKEIAIGKGLGIGSNAAVTFLRLNPVGLKGANMLFTSDSLYTSLIAQVGIFFVIIFILFNVFLFITAAQSKYQGANAIALFVIPVAMVASLGNSLIEFFPVNWLLFIVYGLVLRKQPGLLTRQGVVSESQDSSVTGYRKRTYEHSFCIAILG
ncbi:MAG: hypothetical protein GWN00_14600 [Aliifodinibius sp.]|nr:hypothetical protein [Fodinibius sp.]NIY25989.1 hypothetical protein [Fodinibius sp.]